jgi:hypothetical protein
MACKPNPKKALAVPSNKAALRQLAGKFPKPRGKL